MLRDVGRNGIPHALGDYEELLAAPEVDAIYNPQPNGWHGLCIMAAIRAGKHVLCEKPFAANGQQARAVADMASGGGKVVLEAFHYR